MLQKNQKTELAAALFSALGAEVPHQPELEKEAQALLERCGSRSVALKKVLELCDPAQTPQALYLSAKACAWLGSGWREKNVEFAAGYLQGPPWAQLPAGPSLENGIRTNKTAAVRADLLRDMAQAELVLGRLSDAHSHYMEACRIEPYNAMNFIKAAEVVERRSGREEALRFLRGQRKSGWYAPVKYRDAAGRPCTNELFRELLNAHILKWEQKSGGEDEVP